MRVILLLYDLHLPECHSLKDKRKVVKHLKDRLRSRFNVSVAEVDHLDLWQRAAIAIVFVLSGGSNADSLSSAIDNTINQRTDIEIIKCERAEY